MSILRLLYQTLCAFLQIKDRKHIEQNFHSVAGVMPQGWDLGVRGGSKSLAWESAMAPHRLRILVFIIIRGTRHHLVENLRFCLCISFQTFCASVKTIVMQITLSIVRSVFTVTMKKQQILPYSLSAS